MSGALSYLIFTKLKNRFKGFVKSPGKLIYVLFMLALIAFVIISGDRGAREPEKLRDLKELGAIATGFYSLMFLMLANNGFSRGGSIFTLTDVNLVFSAPVKPSRVLFYGLFQQMGTSLLLGLFILFQYGWIKRLYGVSLGSVLLLLLGYALAVFFGQITATVIYSFTSADDKKRKTVKAVFYGLIGVFAVYAAAGALGGDGVGAGLTRAANGAFIRLFPVGGWLGRAVYGLLSGDALNTALGAALSALFLAGLVAVIIKGRPDYYEDVINSAEAVHSAISAKKEGVVGEAAPANVKLGKIGLGKGFGADAFYYKHLVENRRSRLFIVSLPTLIWAAVIILFAVFMRSSGLSAVFMFATYMQVFSVSMGRLNRELAKPYVYLVPEPPFKKLLQCMREALPSAALEAVLIFVPVAFILGLGPVDTVFCIAARMSFTLLFTSGGILLDRVWSGAGKGLTITLYFIIMLVLAAPGIALAMLLSSFYIIISENVTVLLPLIACNIPVSMLVLFLCKNVLVYAELNNK